VAWAAGPVATGGWLGREGTGTVEGDAADADGWFAGGAGAENVGLTVVGGTINLGGGAAAAGGDAGAFVTGATGVDGGAAATGRAGGLITAGACCLRIAFSTSPGLEILERSILVLISSLLSARVGRDCLAEACASLAPRK